MCGRYTLIATLDELMFRYLAEQPMSLDFAPRYNAAPGQPLMAVIHDGKKNRLGELRWGLIPSWAKDGKAAGGIINARAETLLDKPSFQNLIARKRCIVPADGFYEWRRTGAKKQPMRIVLKNRSLFSMAALYDIWISPEGRKISTCAIITTAPNRLMAEIHDRMPAILRPEDEAVWLDRNNRDAVELQKLLKPYAAEEMIAYPVSSKVGNVRNDSAELIEEIT